MIVDFKCPNKVDPRKKVQHNLRFCAECLLPIFENQKVHEIQESVTRMDHGPITMTCRLYAQRDRLLTPAVRIFAQVALYHY